MKNLFTLLLVALTFVACKNNQPTEETVTVETDPVTVQLTVVNNTGKPLPTHATWGDNVKDT